MSTKKTGLGKSFGSLLPQDFNKSMLIDSRDRIQKVATTSIVPNPLQPRKNFDPETLNEMAQSIKRYGILQPLIVSPGKKSGVYELVAGERRWRAAQLAKLDTLPVIVRKRRELEQLEVALIENVQRVDLSPLEQAVSIEKLHSQFNISYNEIARRLGKAGSTVNNIVRLLQLPTSAVEALQNNEISEGHARAILALKDLPKQQEALLSMIKKHNWTVRQAEQFVTSIKQGADTKPALQKRMASTTPETKLLSKKISAPVSLKRTARGGRLEIHFKTDKELQKIISQLTE